MSATPTSAGQPAPEERSLTLGVRGIGGASLLADIGHEIPTSLLPPLLTSTLGGTRAARSPTTRSAAAGSPSAAKPPPRSSPA